MARAKQNLTTPGSAMGSAFDLQRDLFDFAFDGISSVDVIDVGQGNASAICDNNGTVVMFHDYGGLVDRPDDIATRLDVKVGSDDVLVGHAAILLSHWDLDHFCTARVVPEARTKSLWLAPRQRVGAQAVDLANRLTADSTKPAANVRMWGYNHAIVEWDLGAGCSARIERCTGAVADRSIDEEDRNHSGLALTLIRNHACGVGAGYRAQRYIFVLPGDAPYKYMQSLGTGYRTPDVVCRGLIAYHHGAKTHWSAECASAVRWLAECSYHGALVLSYGENNTYEHPSVTNYINNSWPPCRHYATPELREPDPDGPFHSWSFTF